MKYFLPPPLCGSVNRNKNKKCLFRVGFAYNHSSIHTLHEGNIALHFMFTTKQHLSICVYNNLTLKKDRHEMKEKLIHNGLRDIYHVVLVPLTNCVCVLLYMYE